MSDYLYELPAMLLSAYNAGYFSMGVSPAENALALLAWFKPDKD